MTESPSTVFQAGEEGYTCFRIPAIVQCKSGDLLAFAEGRKNGCSDTGDIDLVMKRSGDGGLHWSSLTVIWNDNQNTCGNPAPVVESKTGHILLLSTWNLGSDREPKIIDQQSEDTRRVFILKSKDEGNTWTAAKEITKKVKLPSWTWYATGPGSGIQIQHGNKAGRIVVGCDHIEAGSKKYFSHAIYSDNRGKSWKLGGSSPLDQVNECEVAELDQGILMMNMRNYNRSQKNRQVMISTDGGESWSNQHHDDVLIEPICQASLQRHHELLFFSNPASQEKRVNMTLRVSQDNGQSWTSKLLLHEGPAAYSDLVSVNKTRIGCLYESGLDSAYEKIVFQVVEW
ncbi:MAG: exo-alpha-sialidase [Saprospiraceae bacterium]|nr:exo-alpha-sialidase [Saprospiraceae bacterium]